MEEIVFSKEIIKANIWLIAFFLLLSLPFILVSDLMLSDWAVKESLTLVGLTYLYICLLLGVEGFFTVRKQLRTRLQLSETELLKLEGKKARRVQWADVSRIRILKKRTGDIHKIIIRSRKGESLTLYGFKNMSYVVDLIKERTSDSVSWRTKQLFQTRKRAFLLATALWVAMLIGIYFIKVHGIM